MIIRLGKLTLVYNMPVTIMPKTILVEEPLIIKVPKIVEQFIEIKQPVFQKVEEPIQIKVPRVVEVYVDVPQPVFRRVEQVIDIPAFETQEVKHQLVTHHYIVNEKPRPILVEKPVIEEIDKVIQVQKVRVEEEELVVPNYRVVRQGEKNIEVPADAIFEVTCPCGNKYTSNFTKCFRCGRTTEENIRHMGEGVS